MVENKKFFIRFIHPIFVCLVYLFLYLPIFILAFFSFNDSVIPVKWVGFSLRWYKALMNNSEILDAFKVSIIVAFFSSIVSLILGTCFVLASSKWRSSFLFNIFYANLILPEIVLGIGILSLFHFFSIPIGYGSLIVGHSVLGLGFVVPIVRARFIELDPILTEASFDLGATYLHTFRKILLPLLMPSLIASFLLVFTISLDDFFIALFCSSSSVQTLSVYVYSMIRAGVDPTINAISTVLILISSLFVFLLCFFKVSDQVIAGE
jgi:spermidine/putrescine transport system permease protein